MKSVIFITMEQKSNNLINLSKGSQSQGASNPLPGASSSPVIVKLCKNRLLKNRLHTLIIARGMSEPDFFSSLGFSRQYWYFISWGIWDTKPEDKIRIAQALGVDSSVIYQSTENKNEAGSIKNGLLH